MSIKDIYCKIKFVFNIANIIIKENYSIKKTLDNHKWSSFVLNTDYFPFFSSTCKQCGLKRNTIFLPIPISVYYEFKYEKFGNFIKIKSKEIPYVKCHAFKLKAILL